MGNAPSQKGMVHLRAKTALHFHFDRKFFEMQYLVYHAQLGTFRVQKWPFETFRAPQAYLEKESCF
jgi:hypothetical protein